MKWLVIILLSALHVPSEANSRLLDSIYNGAKKEKVAKYTPEKGRDFLVLNSVFSKDTVQKVPIKDRRITRIDLVYTSFREDPNFSQDGLNKARLHQLLKNNPELLKNKFFDWKLVEQTGCSSVQQCVDFFHGFVVYYDKYYTKEDMQVEMDTISKNILRLENQITQLDSLKRYNIDEMSCDLPPLVYSDPFVGDEFRKYYRCDENFKGMVFFSVLMNDKGQPTQVDVKGSLFPCKDILSNILGHILRWKRGLQINGTYYPLIAEGKVTFPLQRECVKVTGFRIPEKIQKKFNTEVRGLDCAAYQIDSFYTEIIPKIEKEVVSTTLFRNQWEDDLFIVDATGSMYPYTYDLLKWIRLKTGLEEKTFVFFNDGDDKPTQQKEIGNTGGIDHVTTNSFLEVRNGLFRTMKRGGGGDLLENNIEALLYGVRVANGSSDAVMIVDNNSYPRDAALLKEYAGELKIILCGTSKGLNTDYLSLARQYGFSIHTLTTDLTNLSSLRNGQGIEVDGIVYQVIGDRFRRVQPQL